MDLEVPRPGVFAKTDSIHGIDMNPRHRKPKQKKHPRPHDSHGGSRTPVSSASLFLAYQASRCSKSRKKLRKGSIHPSPQPQSQSSCHQLPFASILPNMAFRIRVFSCIRWTVTKHSGTLVNWLELNAQGFSFSCSCRSFSSRSWEGKKDAFAPAGNIQLAPLSPASRSRLSRAYCSMRSFSACSSASSFSWFAFLKCRPMCWLHRKPMQRWQRATQIEEVLKQEIEII